MSGRPARLLAAMLLGLCIHPAGAGRAAAQAEGEARRFRDGRYLMGTILEITIEDPRHERASRAAEDCFALGARLEALFTTWDPESPTSRMNARAGAPFPAPPELARLLRDAQGFGAATRGSFDVTVGPLIALWKRAAEQGHWPSRAEIDAARSRVGVERIRIDAGGVVTLAPGMAVDFGGLAKGWALDRMGELLRERGIRRALLNFGGSSVLALGAPEGSAGWRLLVGGRSAGMGLVTLRDLSLSVSESLGQSSEVAGRRLGHVIDARSGLPLEGGGQAMVTAPDGATAEALSTALLVLPVAEGMAMLEGRPDLEGWLRPEGKGAAASSGFARATAHRADPAESSPGGL